jgi:drug/metabolite transporter (DMT)-like permease
VRLQQPEARHRPLTPSAALFALFLTGLWSGLGIAIKIGLEDAPPLRLGWLRFVLGAATVLVWALWTRADLVPKRGEGLALLAVGVMFCLELAAMNIGLEKTTASHAAVILSTFSVWMAIFAHFQVVGDRLTTRKLLAALVSYSGIVVIFVQGLAISTDLLFGDLLILVSALVLAEHQVYSARVAGRIHIARLLLARFALGTAVFAVASALLEPAAWSWTPRLAASLLYQGVVIAGFGYVGNLWLLKHYLPSQIGVLSLVGPVASILLAWGLLGETPSPLIWGGTVLVTAGAFLIQRHNSATAGRPGGPPSGPPASRSLR